MPRLDPVAIAQTHPIVFTKPAVRFFEGALLGNGGLGAVVMERPDAIVIAIGHNNVWDRRVDERHGDRLGRFEEILARIQAIDPELRDLTDDPWYDEYCRMTAENYRSPYPRPFPCGRLVLGFDRRRVEVLGHRLDIATGLCTIDLLVDGAAAAVEVFADQHVDRVWIRSATGKSPFNRVHLIPESVPASGTAGQPGVQGSIPMPEWTVLDHPAANHLAFHQRLPSQANDGSTFHQRGEDHAIRVSVGTTARLVAGHRPSVSGYPVPTGALERQVESHEEFVAWLSLEEGQLPEVPADPAHLPVLDAARWQEAFDQAAASWASFWSRSAVKLADDVLERTWYWNLYFLNCSVKPGVTCPGLWANWSMGEIGTAWHGDYHMNYNCQQPFWVTFSSNHVDKHEPYVDLVDHLLPVSRQWARDFYQLPGACFPHSAYPTAMRMMPYPVPTWGWEICETPWTVQSLWWHFQYTQDREFLERRAWGPIREAVEFLVAYIERPSGNEGLDPRYLHIFPTVVPELYGLTPGLRHNADVLADLTLTRFVLDAFVTAANILGKPDPLVERARTVRSRLAPNATAQSAYGEVFICVDVEDPEIVYNTPNAAMPVFPGEEIGIGSPPERFDIAANSWRNLKTEGGNDLVFMNMQGARLGLLDLERFKRQIDYCLLPNGTCSDIALQALGRYSDTLRFDFMGDMGIWFENFALPAVIDECLLQSWDGVIRLFPNWPPGVAAEFSTLRAVGAFLVSAATSGDGVQWVEITSEAGGDLRLINPWTGDLETHPTVQGQTLRFTRTP
jgi:hypothetical protein